MSSEWMRVMLDEIARKKAETEAARAEHERRAQEGDAASRPAGSDEGPENSPRSPAGE